MNKLILIALIFGFTLRVQAQGGNFPKSEQDVYDMLNQFMGGSSVKIEEQDLGIVEPSKFTGSFTMAFETTKADKPIKDGSVTMEFHIDKFQIALIPEKTLEGESRIIMDRKTGQMTMLTIDKKGKKTGIRMKLPKITIEDDGVSENKNNTKVTITNEKKTIEGLSCTKVIIEDEEYKTEAWVTEEKDISLIDIFNYIDISSQKQKGTRQDAYSELSGLAMEATTHNKKNGETTLVNIKNLKKGVVDSKVFGSDGYQLIDMSQMMNFGK